MSSHSIQPRCHSSGISACSWIQPAMLSNGSIMSGSMALGRCNAPGQGVMRVKPDTVRRAAYLDRLVLAAGRVDNGDLVREPQRRPNPSVRREIHVVRAARYMETPLHGQRSRIEHGD